MKTAGALLAIFVTVAGILAGFDSFYARKQWATDQFAQVNYNYKTSRLNQLDYQIIELRREEERRKRFERRGLSPYETNLLNNLNDERKQIRCELRLDRC